MPARNVAECTRDESLADAERANDRDVPVRLEEPRRDELVTQPLVAGDVADFALALIVPGKPDTKRDGHFRTEAFARQGAFPYDVGCSATHNQDRRAARMYVKIGDIDIFYTIAGVGPTCLVPSLAGTPIYERTFTPALQDVMQLVFVELRGNRTATGEIDALTFDAVVDDLDGVRRALGLSRVAVLGHSAHSILALAYAARYPETTSHVLAIAGAPGMRSSPRSSSARASSISSRRHIPGQVSWRSCRTRRTGRSSAAVTTRRWTNRGRLARRWRAGWAGGNRGARRQDHDVRCATLPLFMSNRKTSKRTAASSDLDPATLASVNVLKRQRQRMNRTLLKRRRQKSGQ